jgi:hypothetical protein
MQTEGLNPQPEVLNPADVPTKLKTRWGSASFTGTRALQLSSTPRVPHGLGCAATLDGGGHSQFQTVTAPSH